MSIDQYVVIGNPVAHSLSPLIHQAFATQTNQSLQYTQLLAPLDAFSATVLQFQKQGGRGANVTLPFKQSAYQLANEASNAATQAGAANTLLFRPDGSIYADNTDGAGFIRDLQHNHGFNPLGKKLLLLGAGGAARGLIQPLLAAKPQQLVIANRTLETATQLVADFRHPLTLPTTLLLASDLADLAQTTATYDLIINTTSAGLSGEPLTLSPLLINPQTWCYDLVYGKNTPFLQWASTHGAMRCLDGLGMLVEQAALAFQLWRQVHPLTAPVIAMLSHTP